jgi:hypothetical protein
MIFLDFLTFQAAKAKSMKNLNPLHLFLPLLVIAACQSTEQVNSTTNSLTASNPDTSATEVPPQPFAEPNLVAEVQVESGTCPETVGIYSFLLPYEGGAEHTAVADLWGMAQLPELVTQQETYIEYQATLSDRYTDCVGTANIEMPDVYTFTFQDGKVTFSVDLQEIDAPALAITYHDLVAQRPYIRWAIAN